MLPNAFAPVNASASDAPATGAELVNETVTRPVESVVYVTSPVDPETGVTDDVPYVPDHVGVTVMSAAATAAAEVVWPSAARRPPVRPGWKSRRGRR